MEYKTIDTDNYVIERIGGKNFVLGAYYYDDYYGPSEVTLDALQVYKDLKEFFKGTKYE